MNLLPSEIIAVTSVVAQLASKPVGNKRFNIPVELEEDARKHAVALIGILPLLEARSEKNVLYVSCDGSADASTRVKAVELMVLSKRLEFTTLEELLPLFDHGETKKILSGRWVICDMDRGRLPDANVDRGWLARQNEKRYRTLNQIIYSHYCDRVLIHQKGKPCFTKQFPPQSKAGCFIATAACGSGPAWEIDVLCEFRDTILCESAIGRFVVGAYYRFSRPLAQLIEPHPLLQKTVRSCLITPLARLIMRKGVALRSL
jgi:hypothetical protein